MTGVRSYSYHVETSALKVTIAVLLPQIAATEDTRVGLVSGSVSSCSCDVGGGVKVMEHTAASFLRQKVALFSLQIPQL